jgi:hypothetical protein
MIIRLMERWIYISTRPDIYSLLGIPFIHNNGKGTKSKLLNAHIYIDLMALRFDRLEMVVSPFCIGWAGL